MFSWTQTEWDFFLQIRAESIIIMVTIIINIVVVVDIGQFANKKCAPAI